MAVLAEKRAVRFSEAPEGFIPPCLNPTDVKLVPKELAPGVYGLISGRPFVDNSGFVIGERGVLVIDSHINGSMANQILDAVGDVTDKPVLYLVNTNYHGDHCFGNYAFPWETRIVSHWTTRERMRDFDEEKEFLLPTVEGDRSIFDDVKLRLPDIVFENCLHIDIGDRIVGVRYFGPGNTMGDTVVYLPDKKIAWTGNLILGDGSIPALFEGGAGRYLETIARFERALEVETIVPGHGRMTTPTIFARYMRYLSELIEPIHTAIRAGRSLDETLDSMPLADQFMPTEEPMRTDMLPFLKGLHRFNVQITYRELAEKESTGH